MFCVSHLGASHLHVANNDTFLYKVKQNRAATPPLLPSPSPSLGAVPLPPPLLANPAQEWCHPSRCCTSGRRCQGSTDPPGTALAHWDEMFQCCLIKTQWCSAVSTGNAVWVEVAVFPNLPLQVFSPLAHGGKELWSFYIKPIARNHDGEPSGP